jgi:hypothetical protein
MSNQRKKNQYPIGKSLLGLRTDTGGSTPVQETEQDIRQESSSRCEVPEFCTLDGFAQVVERNGGMDLNQLEPLTCLAVETDSAVFLMTLLNPSDGEVLIQGGEIFTQPFKAKIAGATFGGSFLKTRWIGVGMQMEICCNDGTLITTPVRTVKIKKQSNLPGPF